MTHWSPGAALVAAGRPSDGPGRGPVGCWAEGGVGAGGLGSKRSVPAPGSQARARSVLLAGCAGAFRVFAARSVGPESLAARAPRAHLAGPGEIERRRLSLSTHSPHLNDPVEVIPRLLQAPRHQLRAAVPAASQIHALIQLAFAAGSEELGD